MIARACCWFHALYHSGNFVVLDTVHDIAQFIQSYRVSVAISHDHGTKARRIFKLAVRLHGVCLAFSW